MSISDWIALATLLLAAVGSAAAVWVHLTGKISGHTRDLHGKIDEVYEKIDEVKRDYVRRDDLRDDLHNLKEDINRIERGQENVAVKVDSFGTSLLPAIADLARAAISLGKGN